MILVLNFRALTEKQDERFLNWLLIKCYILSLILNFTIWSIVPSSTHFCRIRDGRNARHPPPLSHPYVLNDETYPNNLYIIGKKIYRRFRFISDIDKIFCFRNFMNNFHEMTPQWLQKKFRLLKYEHNIYHFKAHAMEIPSI